MSNGSAARRPRRGTRVRYTPAMPVSAHKLQTPKGTRDFYPDDQAVRRHIEGVWRTVSVNHGFDEIDGPTFEHLQLYTIKSGPGIVSELFSFRRADGDTDYALRPEFTPTLARMVAAKGSSLTVPTRWFCMAPMFRAERPQRGRLREHIQWNADVFGTDDPSADAEVVAVAVGVLETLGLTPADVRVRLSHRGLVGELLTGMGVDPARLPDAFGLLDRRDKITPDELKRQAAALDFDEGLIERFDEVASTNIPLDGSWSSVLDRIGGEADSDDLMQVHAALRAVGVSDWCDLSLGIVRGLAYYTGTVFEVHEGRGRERAIAGGGRYDDLVELFGGSSTPAVGIAMGDVVIRLVLEDKGLLQTPETYMPRPDAFVIAADDAAAEQVRGVVADLRRGGLHVRHSSRSTRNVGKLLGEAAKTRARWAVILGRELADGRVVVKDLDGGDQHEVALESVRETIASR